MVGASSANKRVSFLKTLLNAINSMCGIGMLSMPYALASGGWLSLILMLLIAASACFTGHLIRRCLDSNPLITTYSDIAGTAFGKKAKIVASIILCLELYLYATSLLILGGDTLHKIYPNYSLSLGGLKLDGRHSFVIIAGISIIPSMWISHLGVLAYMSFGGVLSSLVLIVCVFCVGTTKKVGFHGKGNPVNFKGLPTAVSLYIFGYGAHSLFPSLYISMRKKNQFSMVLLLSFIVCTITYMSMALLGYLIYGYKLQSQVTLNLPKEKISSKIAIYTIVAVPIVKYALNIIPIVCSIESLLPKNYQDNKTISFLIKLILLISTMVLAVVIPSFDSVTSLIGALLSVTISFLIPCICYLKIFKVYENIGYELIGISVLILLGVLVGVVGTYSSIVQTVKQAQK